MHNNRQKLKRVKKEIFILEKPFENLFFFVGIMRPEKYTNPIKLVPKKCRFTYIYFQQIYHINAVKLHKQF